MLSVTRIFTLCGAHRLPNYDGKCQTTHGHNWKVEVTVGGEKKAGGSEDGMIMDFGRLKNVVQTSVIDLLDHTMLNDTLPEWAMPPTAENMCLFIASELLSKHVKVTHIRVWETDNSHADWRVDK